MTDRKCFVFKFADAEVREREFLLIRAGERIPLEPKAFRVLLFLLRAPNRLIRKDEIVSAVWEGVSVSDNSLTRSIAALRRLLGDDSREPRYIATVPTVGYRFLCPVDVWEDASDTRVAPDLHVTAATTAERELRTHEDLPSGRGGTSPRGCYELALTFNMGCGYDANESTTNTLRLVSEPIE